MDAGRRAVEAYRKRMREQGLDRYEVRGLREDIPLIRALASRLSAGGTEADSLRRAVMADLMEEIAGPRGGILECLRRSPLVGVEISVEREFSLGRDFDL